MRISAIALGLALSACLWANAFAQPPAGPTMDETMAWLESQGRDLMRTHRLQDDSAHLAFSESQEQVDAITIKDCTLFWRTVRLSKTTSIRRGESHVSPITTTTSDVVLVLSDLSLGGITVEPDTFLTDTPVHVVRLVMRQPREATSTQSTDSGYPEVIRWATLPAQTAEDGQRIANAIKRIAVLCGVTTGGIF